MYLINFSPVSHFYTPWKRQKTFGFLTFSGGIEMWQWTKMGQSRHFYSCTYSSLKTLPRVIIITSKAAGNYSFPKAAFFRKSVSLNSRKEWGKPMISLSEFNQKIWRWLRTFGYLYFAWFVIFSNVMVLQFCDNIYHIVWY